MYGKMIIYLILAAILLVVFLHDVVYMALWQMGLFQNIIQMFLYPLEAFILGYGMYWFVDRASKASRKS